MRDQTRDFLVFIFEWSDKEIHSELVLEREGEGAMNKITEFTF